MGLMRSHLGCAEGYHSFTIVFWKIFPVPMDFCQGENEKTCSFASVTLQANGRGPRANVIATSESSPVSNLQRQQETYRKVLFMNPIAPRHMDLDL